MLAAKTANVCKESMQGKLFIIYTIILYLGKDLLRICVDVITVLDIEINDPIVQDTTVRSHISIQYWELIFGGVERTEIDDDEGEVLSRQMRLAVLGDPDFEILFRDNKGHRL